MNTTRFKTLLQEVRACDHCALHLRVPPKPVVQLNQKAKVLVIAQAPGSRARASGRPFDDASGERLRSWLNVNRDTFYDETQFAFMPMGFCYPGTNKGGDLPPCRECAPLWHPQIIPYLRNVSLTLLVGTYAHRYYLKTASVKDAVANYRKYQPDTLALPHPSWHNTNWIRNNPWFHDEVVPLLQSLISKLVQKR